MEVSTKNATNLQKTTDRGTPIVKPGEEMNKNSFLKILAAEMSNQDPTKPQDTTAYITQLSQFASLEQMANLNTTMRLSGAQNLNGKFVALDVRNSSGIQEAGVVRAVFKRSNEIFITVEDGNGNIKDYSYDQVTDILDISDGIQENLNFINASSLIGKTVEIPDKEKKIQGIVKEVYKGQEGIMVKVDVDGQVKDYPYSYIVSIKQT